LRVAASRTGRIRDALIRVLRGRSLGQAVASLPVRYRIAAIAVLPVLGFVAIGIAFTSGEIDVGRAFTGTKEAAWLAGASREFRGGLDAMKFSAKDFAANPHANLITVFKEGHAETTRSWMSSRNRKTLRSAISQSSFRTFVASLKRSRPISRN